MYPMKSITAHSLVISLILTVGCLTSAQAVTDAELEALEKQIEQLEAEEIKQAEAKEKKKIEAEAKRKTEQKRKAEAEAEKKRLVELEKQRQEKARLAELEQKRLEIERRRGEEGKRIELANRKLYTKLINEGDAALKLHHKSDAIAKYREALEIFPDDMVVKEKLTKANNILGNGEKFYDRLKDGSPGPAMIVVPPGKFKMGDTQNSKDIKMASAQPVHEVSISKPYAMGIYEITFEEYDRFTQSTKRQLLSDHGWGRGKHPAVKVPWAEAVAYAEWLSAETEEHYRLPSEAEWEYAARAGTTTNFWWGDVGSHEYANYGKGVGGWFPSGVVSGKDQWMYTSPVGSFPANPFGLYDMNGNAWEHVQDCWHNNYTDAPSDGSAWLVSRCSLRVMRSGSYGYEEMFLWSAIRVQAYWAVKSFLYYGFRLVREIPDYE
jgi:formylglycine-generating enzyme required for sulfatase activity